MYLDNEKGLGLIELIITTIVMTFIVLGTFSFQINMNQVSRQSSARYQMQTQGNETLNYVNRYLELANNGPDDMENNPLATCSNGGNVDTNGGYNDIIINNPEDTCATGGEACKKSKGYQYRFWSILSGNITTNPNYGYVYMKQIYPAVGPQQILVGDYNDGKFGIRALQFAAEHDNGIGTVDVIIKLGLFDLETDSMIESMRFISAVKPRNQS